MLSNNSCYFPFLHTKFETNLSLSDEIYTWCNTTYEHNPLHPEHLIPKSVSNHFVRSKSECMIDLALYQHGVPSRYECILILGDRTLYPDFTTRHPRTGDYIYWEHHGLMDDPNYARNTFQKHQLYAQHGILPSINLITTYETKNHPLTFDLVDKIIQHYYF